MLGGSSRVLAGPGVITAVAYIVFMMIGFFVVVLNFCKGDFDLNKFAAMSKAAQQDAAQQLIQAFYSNTLHPVTMELFAIGGFLLIRYIIDRMPDKKEPEIHWMDRMEQK